MTFAPWSAHQRAAATMAELSRTPLLSDTMASRNFPPGGMRQGATMQPCVEVISSAPGASGPKVCLATMVAPR
jgi:hypothetical protein